jgi:ATP synthase protein I
MARKGEYRQITEQVILITQLGLTMVGSILFCFAIGYYLDKWLGTKGVFLTIFILLGIAGGGWTIWRQIQEIGGDSPSEKKEDADTKKRS